MRLRNSVSYDFGMLTWKGRIGRSEERRVLSDLAINLGDELGQSVESSFDFAPVVLCLPVVSELLHGSELHALRSVRHELALRPLRCLYASAQFRKFRFRNVDMEGTDWEIGRATCAFRSRHQSR